MKRTEILIDYVRKMTGNVIYDSNSGIGQDIMSRYFNNAQDELAKAFVNSKTKFLQKSKDYTIVNNQQEYDYPEDIFLQAIDTLMWTQDNQNYVVIKQGYTKYRTTNQIGYGFAYYTQDSGFILTPPLQSGALVLNYMRKLPQLGCRAGQISSVTINGSNQVTALVVSTSGSYNAADIASDNFLCVVDYLGNIKATKIQYSTESSGTFTIVPTTLETGETAAIGDYIVIGRYATNKPELPDICEGYLIKNAYYQVKYGDASQWTKAVQDDMLMTTQTLMDSINSTKQDVTEIMITNWDSLALW